MKKILVMALALCLLAVPAFAANYYLTGFSGAGTVEDPRCTTISKTLDSMCNSDWMLESDAYTFDVVQNSETHSWALVRINYSDYSTFDGLSGVYLLPVFPFDVEMAAMTNSTKTALSNALAARSIPSTCVSQSDAFRDVVRCIGQQINQGFSEIPWGN